MAKWTITHSCGHQQVHQLFGSMAERESKETWLAGGPCDECRRAAKAAEHEAKGSADALACQAAGCVPLQGTPKQVAWGESIRAAAVATIAHRRAVRDAAIAVRGGVDQLTDAERRQIDAEEQAVAWLYAMPAASYWIDRRDESIEDHIIELAKEVL